MTRLINTESNPDVLSPAVDTADKTDFKLTPEQSKAVYDFLDITTGETQTARFKRLNNYGRVLQLHGRPVNQFELEAELKKRLSEGTLEPEDLIDPTTNSPRPMMPAIGSQRMEHALIEGLKDTQGQSLYETEETELKPVKIKRPNNLNQHWNTFNGIVDGTNKRGTLDEYEEARVLLRQYYTEALNDKGNSIGIKGRKKFQDYINLLNKGLTELREERAKNLPINKDKNPKNYDALLQEVRTMLDEMEQVAKTGGATAADEIWRARSGDGLNAQLDNLQKLPKYRDALVQITNQIDRIEEAKKNYKAPIVPTHVPSKPPVTIAPQAPFPTSRTLPPTIPSRETVPTSTPEQVPPTRTETPAVEQPQPAPARTEAEIRRELENRLNEAREKYLRNKKAWQGAQGVMGWLTNKEEKDRVQSEFDKAKIAYETARAEYVGVEIELALAERIKFEDAEAKILFGEKPPGIIRKFYQRLGETSILGVDVKNSTSWIKKFAFNNRTLISAGLLGASIAASGPLGWVAAGGSLMLARRAFSGLGAGFAVRDLFTNARRVKVENQKLEENATLEEQNQAIQTFKSRALVDGAYSTLESNPAYLALIAARDAKMKQEFAEATPEQRAELIKNFFERQEDISAAAIEQEKKWNRRALAAGIGAGVFIGSGAANVVADKAMTGIKEGYAWFKDMIGMRFAPDIAHAAEVASASSAEAGNISLEVGSRGIEGALLDLKNSNPDAYKAMIENMRSSDPNFQGSDAGVIHRYVENFAEANGYNVDGGDAKDLSRILSSGVTVDTATGNVSIENIKFMPERVVESVAEPVVHEEVADAQESMDSSSTTEPVSSEQTNSTERANRFLEASLKPTTTEALRVVLSPESYTKFLTDMGLNEEKLNVLTDKTYLEFLAFCKESPENLETYGKLADLFTDNKIPMMGQGGMKMKEVLIAVAEGRGR